MDDNLSESCTSVLLLCGRLDLQKINPLHTQKKPVSQWSLFQHVSCSCTAQLIKTSFLSASSHAAELSTVSAPQGISSALADVGEVERGIDV